MKFKDRFVKPLITAGVIMFLGFGSMIATEKDQVNGMSMSPTLDDKQTMIVLNDSFNLSGVDFGDVVTAHPAGYKAYVKRVVGLPGDTIEYKNNTLYRNGKPLTDFHSKDMLSKMGAPENDGAWDFELGDGEYYLLSDNLAIETEDSRTIGPVMESDIIGEVLFY